LVVLPAYGVNSDRGVLDEILDVMSMKYFGAIIDVHFYPSYRTGLS
jgi:hypothetical protein